MQIMQNKKIFRMLCKILTLQDSSSRLNARDHNRLGCDSDDSLQLRWNRFPKKGVEFAAITVSGQL